MIVPDAEVRSVILAEVIVVVARVDEPFTVRWLLTITVSAVKSEIKPVIALKNEAKRLDEVALVVEALVAKKLVAVAEVKTDDEPFRLANVPVVLFKLVIVAEAEESEEMVPVDEVN